MLSPHGQVPCPSDAFGVGCPIGTMRCADCKGMPMEPSVAQTLRIKPLDSVCPICHGERVKAVMLRLQNDPSRFFTALQCEECGVVVNGEKLDGRIKDEPYCAQLKEEAVEKRIRELKSQIEMMKKTTEKEAREES